MYTNYSFLFRLHFSCNYDPPGNYINEELANVKPALNKKYKPKHKQPGHPRNHKPYKPKPANRRPKKPTNQ